MLLYFKNKLTSKPAFSQGELSLILGVYGERVKRGEWRDYAIDSLPDMAAFSVFRSSRENPAYVIAKLSARSFLKPAEFVVYEGGKTLRQSASLREVLEIFEDPST
ncbi:MAG: DUF2794 domain-containing protein [Bdellovibrionales bacterium]|jgi:hypothetical protein|nr:DUF2794 domain-containing protein [Bdellovibrionales bacterium]